MTNSQIIMNESIRLMKSGVIGTTGEKIEYVNANGEVIEMDKPEAIHTYQVWKMLGYQVQKGEKAIAKFNIWKHVSKRNEEKQIDESKMFMTKASFFKASQVAPIQ